MLKLIAWIIFFYLLFRLLRNVLGPMLGMSRKVQNPYGQTPFGQQHQQQYQQRREGETTFHKPENNSSRKNDDDGEYIEYKEIKE